MSHSEYFHLAPRAASNSKISKRRKEKPDSFAVGFFFWSRDSSQFDCFGDEGHNRFMNEKMQKGETGPEQVTHRALRYNGELFLDGSHAGAMMKLMDAYPDFDPIEEMVNVDYGFVTSKDRFVHKEEGDEMLRNPV